MDSEFSGAAAWWIPGEGTELELRPDRYAAFRGTFELTADAVTTLRVFGAHVFVAWLDGEYLIEGPWRFPLGHAEYETVTVTLKAGRHVLGALVRSERIETRMLQSQLIPPFFMAQALDGGRNVSISWKAVPLPGYIASGQRLSPQFAWIEWSDTRLNPYEWQKPAFDDSAWYAPIEVKEVREWNLQPVDAERLKRREIPLKLIGEGKLSGPFEHRERPGWQTDDGFPWYRRNLAPTSESNGVWRRYDLGYVMLGSPQITLDLPAGVVVEIAWSEVLRDDRVTPFIPLSLGPTRNMDHFVSRGGVQIFAPMMPKGGRYLEIHVDSPEARFIGETYWQRCYYGEPVGAFTCGDALLDRIWQLGIDTLRSCSEDAIIDNPTRERGQWTGDVLLSLYIAAAGFNDVRLFKRGLQHSAWCAREDGMVAGLAPGGPGYLSTYSAQWTTAALNYYVLTGDRALLEELFPAAVRNMEVFLKVLGPEGIPNFEWPFVDWGYPGCKGSSTEMGVNMHVLEALRSMQAWCGLLEKDAAVYRDAEMRLAASINAWLQPRVVESKWREIDYHCTTLALRNGLIADDRRAEAIAFLKEHTLACFPNDRNASTLANPDYKDGRLISPYFCYYSLEELAKAGEMDFVLEQYRRCWGWSLEEGLTTQPEQFDLNWSHCHVWGSSPTAQMTRWLLGLRPQFSHGLNHYELTLDPGSTASASGKVPLIGQSGAISVQWKRNSEGAIEYQVDPPVPIWLHWGDEVIAIDRKAVLTLAI